MAPLTQQHEAECQPCNSPNSIGSKIEDVIAGIPSPPAELGWLAILGVIISLMSLIKKR